jgi:hypothetical protein
MTESHKPYISGRKKVYTVKIASDMPRDEFEQHLHTMLFLKGWKYEGVVEVAYEEEKE